MFIGCNDRDEISRDEYRNSQGRRDHFFHEIELLREVDFGGRLSEVNSTDYQGEVIEITFGRLKGHMSQYHDYAGLVQDKWIEPSEIKYLARKIEESRREYFFSLEIDRGVDGEYLSEFLDSLDYYSEMPVMVEVINVEGHRERRALPRTFRF